jgi:predicted DNA-binding transcriptional regulator AlpA
MPSQTRRPLATTEQDLAEAASRAAKAIGHPRRPLATTEQVAGYLGISVPALLQLRYLGRAPKAAKVGTRLRWNWKDVDDYIEQRASTSTKA